jgi:hypothetical protein
MAVPMRARLLAHVAKQLTTLEHGPLSAFEPLASTSLPSHLTIASSWGYFPKLSPNVQHRRFSDAPAPDFIPAVVQQQQKAPAPKPQQQSSAAVPGTWEAVTDEKTGQTYWWDKQTGTSKPQPSVMALVW